MGFWELLSWDNFSASTNWNFVLPFFVIAVTLGGYLISIKSSRQSEKAIKYAEQAVKFAQHAWLDPMPKFDCLSKSAEYFKLDDGGYLGKDGHDKKNGYIFKINLSLQNISNVPAPIRDIHINDFVLSADGAKETRVRIKTPESLLVRCSPQLPEEKPFPRYNLILSSSTNIRPNETLDIGVKGKLRVAIAFEDIPKKITVNIHTPNRKEPFPFIIEKGNIREETIEGNACDWFK